LERVRECMEARGKMPGKASGEWGVRETLRRRGGRKQRKSRFQGRVIGFGQEGVPPKGVDGET